MILPDDKNPKVCTLEIVILQLEVTLTALKYFCMKHGDQWVFSM